MINYLDTGSITCGIVNSYQEIPLDKAPSRAKRLVKDGDIVYSLVRPIQRHYGYIKNPPKNLVVSTGFSVIETREEIADSFFIYNFLSSKKIIEYLDSVAEGSTSAYPSLKPSDIEQLDILLPPLSEQHAIAGVLSSLDDKIDLLHRQNMTLEVLAETLFRQWFVEEADERWEETTLNNVITVKGGTTPSTKVSEYWNGDICWTSPRDLTNHVSIFMFDTERKITAKGLTQIGSGILPVGTVLLSSRAPIGYLVITDVPLAINQGYIGIICDKKVSNYFMFFWCRQYMNEIKNVGNGSVFQEISKSSFKSLIMQLPPEELLRKFDLEVKSICEKVKINQIQIRTLETFRDTLLPKLMSGEVRVAL